MIQLSNVWFVDCCSKIRICTMSILQVKTFTGQNSETDLQEASVSTSPDHFCKVLKKKRSTEPESMLSEGKYNQESCHHNLQLFISLCLADTYKPLQFTNLFFFSLANQFTPEVLTAIGNKPSFWNLLTSAYMGLLCSFIIQEVPTGSIVFDLYANNMGTFIHGCWCCI